MLTDLNGPYAHCHGRVGPVSFYESCITEPLHYGDYVINSYNMVCEETSNKYHSAITVRK